MKTRFGSVILVLDLLVEYRAAVSDLDTQVGDLSLQKRNPSEEEWFIAETVSKTLKPVTQSCCAVQESQGYFISDTLNAIFFICDKM